jgi:hypothetical protein
MQNELAPTLIHIGTTHCCGRRGFINHVALVLVLIIRKRWRDFTVFTAFVAYEVFTTILLFVVWRHGTRHGE